MISKLNKIDLVEKILKKNKYNMKKTAEELNISRQWLYCLVRDYDIDLKRKKPLWAEMEQNNEI